jgi:DNA-binding GntR family transcriptional regulator
MRDPFLGDEGGVTDLSVGGTSYNRIRDAIRASIFSREFPPGSRLKVLDLAKHYAISPIPIREALQQLQGEGLVVITPNRGATVRVIDRVLIGNIFDIREAIDGMLARVSAPLATPAHIDRLRRIEDSIQEAVAVNELERAGELGRQFHEYIGHIANNLEAVTIRRTHANIFRSVKSAMGYRRARIPERREEHLAIIEALARHDPVEAQAMAQRHAQSWRQAVIGHFEELDAAG